MTWLYFFKLTFRLVNCMRVSWDGSARETAQISQTVHSRSAFCFSLIIDSNHPYIYFCWIAFCRLRDFLTFQIRIGTPSGVVNVLYRTETQKDLVNWARSIVQSSHDAAAAQQELSCSKNMNPLLKHSKDDSWLVWIQWFIRSQLEQAVVPIEDPLWRWICVDRNPKIRERETENPLALPVQAAPLFLWWWVSAPLAGFRNWRWSKGNFDTLSNSSEILWQILIGIFHCIGVGSPWLP